MPALTDDQLRERQAYLGGTDMAVIAGVDRWHKPIDVWLEKTGQAPERVQTKRMALGHLLEQTVCDLFVAATGYRVRSPAKTIHDRKRPWFAANIDRYASLPHWTPTTPDLPWRYALLEVKTSDEPDLWGAQGTDKVPAGYLVQVQHYLGVTGRPGAYLAVLLPRADFRWYRIPRDDETITMLRDLGTRFWHDHVLTGVPPEPDGSETYSRFLARRGYDDGSEAVATAEQMFWIEQVRDLERQADDLTEQARQYRQVIANSMGSTRRLIVPDGKAILYHSYDRATTDWKAVAYDIDRLYLLATHKPAREEDITADLTPLVTAHTTTTPVRSLVIPKTQENPDA